MHTVLPVQARQKQPTVVLLVLAAAVCCVGLAGFVTSFVYSYGGKSQVGAFTCCHQLEIPSAVQSADLLSCCRRPFQQQPLLWGVDMRCSHAAGHSSRNCRPGSQLQYCRASTGPLVRLDLVYLLDVKVRRCLAAVMLLQASWCCLTVEISPSL